ncbi:hypothetical protein ABID49_000158 [Bhargavaea ullalensis]|uniref:Uncharacterized protein n=1 Tax=Bhargavaea ullalensis TaxID=1265685 RepID=A0ABV2G8A2_9BACL
MQISGRRYLYPAERYLYLPKRYLYPAERYLFVELDFAG